VFNANKSIQLFAFVSSPLKEKEKKKESISDFLNVEPNSSS
jgi:hypothetical protein